MDVVASFTVMPLSMILGCASRVRSSLSSHFGVSVKVGSQVQGWRPRFGLNFGFSLSTLPLRVVPGLDRADVLAP